MSCFLETSSNRKYLAVSPRQPFTLRLGVNHQRSSNLVIPTCGLGPMWSCEICTRGKPSHAETKNFFKQNQYVSYLLV